MAKALQTGRLVAFWGEVAATEDPGCECNRDLSPTDKAGLLTIAAVSRICAGEFDSAGLLTAAILPTRLMTWCLHFELGAIGAQPFMRGRVHHFHINRVLALVTKIKEMRQLVLVDGCLFCRNGPWHINHGSKPW